MRIYVTLAYATFHCSYTFSSDKYVCIVFNAYEHKRTFTRNRKSYLLHLHIHVVAATTVNINNNKIIANNENDTEILNFISFLIMYISLVLPTRDVEIIGIKPFYQVGEVLQANCTCYNSIPSALLEWKINSFPVSTSFFSFSTYIFL